MNNFLYLIWLAIPLLFFGMALWSKLESLSGKQMKDRPSELMRQGGFILLCVAVSIAIEMYLLRSLYDSFFPNWIPYGFLQFMLLPLVLYIAAVVIGPSKDIRISKAPHPTRKQKKQ